MMNIFLGFLLSVTWVLSVNAEPLRITATTGMVADGVRAVGGEQVVVKQLIGAGVDPHLYRLTRSDLGMMAASDGIVLNGLFLEGKMGDSIKQLSKRVRGVYEIASPLKSILNDGAPDPHIWMDPVLWSEAVAGLPDFLSKLSPGERVTFQSNAKRYLQQLERLHRYGEQVLSTVPEKILVTAHDAFQYFGKRYGFQVIGIQGLSTESEAGVYDIERIVTILVERKIPAVFIESTVSEKNIRALLEGAAAKGHTVQIGGELFSDAYGADGTYEGSYIGMIDHNFTTIARALGGEAPERGMDGKLSARGK